jgi:hypothetical protein
MPQYFVLAIAIAGCSIAFGTKAAEQTFFKSVQPNGANSRARRQSAKPAGRCRKATARAGGKPPNTGSVKGGLIPLCGKSGLGWKTCSLSAMR